MVGRYKKVNTFGHFQSERHLVDHKSWIYICLPNSAVPKPFHELFLHHLQTVLGIVMYLFKDILRSYLLIQFGGLRVLSDNLGNFFIDFLHVLQPKVIEFDPDDKTDQEQFIRLGQEQMVVVETDQKRSQGEFVLDLF